MTQKTKPILLIRMLGKYIFSIIMCFNLALSYGQNSEDFKKYNNGTVVSYNASIIIDKFILFEYKTVAENDFLKIYSKKKMSSELEQSISNSYSFSNTDSTRNFIGLVYSFSFNWAGKKTAIIKYFEVKDGTNIGYKSFTFQLTKQGWVRYNNPNFNSIVFVNKKLTTDAFWQFYNKTNNPSYPEINALKPQVQDANGVLNLEKLATVIKANQTQLAKYLDE